MNWQYTEAKRSWREAIKARNGVAARRKAIPVRKREVTKREVGSTMKSSAFCKCRLSKLPPDTIINEAIEAFKKVGYIGVILKALFRIADRVGVGRIVLSRLGDCSFSSELGSNCKSMESIGQRACEAGNIQLTGAKTAS